MASQKRVRYCPEIARPDPDDATGVHGEELKTANWSVFFLEREGVKGICSLPCQLQHCSLMYMEVGG